MKDNLNLKMAVQLYCNTDWPTLVNDPYFPGGPNGATALDAGTTDGQYSPGTGAWCRINGTKYDVSVASGAPPVPAGYNYPWQSSSGTPNAQYFYRQVSNKILYCDTTSPYFPRTTKITSCIGGTTTLTGASAQTCNAQSPVCNPNPLLKTYNPAACNPANVGWVAGQWCAGGSAAGATGVPVECQTCGCVADTAPVPAKKCSLSGLTCAVNADCPPFSNTISNCGAGIPNYALASPPSCSGSPNGVMWDPVANAPGTTTLLADANGAGVVCRHNVQSYAVYGLPQPGILPAGLSIYPRTMLADVQPANKVGWAAPYTNQTGAFTTPTTSSSVGCPVVGTTVPIPRHYYVIDSVDFCPDRIVTADVQWKGFGTGVCNPTKANDLANYKEVKYGKFTRVDLFAGNAVPFPGSANADKTYKLSASATPFPNGRVWLAGSNPGPDNSESVNYANWYAYYSTRLNAAKTTSSIGFSFLTAGAGDPIAYRVGFHNLGEEPATYGGAGTPIIWADVKDWDLAQRTSWYAKLFGIAVLTYKTPTIDAMLRIGNLFEKGGSTGLPASVNPLPATAADPISKDASNNLISCQNNYHILFTDGVTNQVTPTTYVGDQDGSIPGFLTSVAPYPATNTDEDMATLKLGGAWPRPFVQDTTVPNTLSDIATRYWATDLRDGTWGLALKNDVPAEIATGGGDTFIDVKSGRAKDVAWWQHVNFSAISFGAQGTLDATNQGATMAAIKANTLKWPNLTQPNNPIYPRGAGAGAVAVDDLWHATLNARGTFVYAKSPADVSYGISRILAGIQNQRKSRAGAAFNGQVLDNTNNIIFEPTIEKGWAGDLLKVQILPASGLPDTTVGPNGIWWQASVELPKQILPAFVGDEPWMNPAKRRIVTLGNALGAGNSILGPGVPFQHASLFAAPVGPAMLNSLAPAPSGDTTQQQKIIAYLRGGNTFNAGAITIEGIGQGQFRQRFGALGDISNAQPIIIGPPGRLYSNATDPGYAPLSPPDGTSFVERKSGRTWVVVAPANDGMVHVFNAGNMPPATPAPGDGGGSEIFSYIPRALFRGVAGAAATEDVTGIQALTYQDGGVPIYHHHMYVDSSPRAADVDFNNGTGASDWRTIVVGGLGKGGNSFYALDLTDVAVPDETTAAGKVLWEWFNPDADVGPGQRLVTGGSPGYSYGHPVIVKVRENAVTYPTGRWVVIVTGGYNNLSGKGKVYFLDAKTGQLLSTVTTPAGSTIATTGSNTNPQGLAQIHAFVRNENDQTIEQIYGGDLLGNTWRIDVSARSNPLAAPDYLANIYNGVGGLAPATVLFAELKDPPPTNAVQPVTTAPQIEIDLNNGIDRYVFFGTGRLLDPSDLTNPATPQPQTFYAIRDGTLQSVMTAGLPIQPRNTMSPINPDGTSGVAGGAPNGWYQDLPSDPNDPILGAQRIVTDPQSQVNIAAYIGTKIQDDPCVISLPAYLYARDYTSGASLLENGGGTIVPYLDFPGGGVGLQLVGRTQPDGSLSLGAMVSGEIPGTTPVNIKNPVTGPGIRWSWRLLTGE